MNQDPQLLKQAVLQKGLFEELKDLPMALRRRPLIMVARALFGVLAERLGLPHLVHVEAPPSQTQLIRRQVLPRIEAAIEAELARRPD